MLKGNPNFKGILNLIIQILLYHCDKQHKNIKNLLFTEQNKHCYLFLPFSLLTSQMIVRAVAQKTVFAITLFLIFNKRKSIQIFLNLKLKTRISYTFFCTNRSKVTSEHPRNSYIQIPLKLN